METRNINFHFINKADELIQARCAGKPSFYNFAPVGSIHGFVIANKDAAYRLRQIADHAVKHYESEDAARMKPISKAEGGG